MPSNTIKYVYTATSLPEQLLKALFMLLKSIFDIEFQYRNVMLICML